MLPTCQIVVRQFYSLKMFKLTQQGDVCHAIALYTHFNNKKNNLIKNIVLRKSYFYLVKNFSTFTSNRSKY